jgi:hypothetical protein
MERLIAEARRNNQPAYILVPSDYAQAPITPVEVRPVTSNEAALKKAIAAISERLKGAKSVVALPAFTVARLGLQKRIASGEPLLGGEFPLRSITAAVIGGCSLRGGQGAVGGVVLGVLFVTILANGMDLLRLGSNVQMVILGMVEPNRSRRSPSERTSSSIHSSSRWLW